MDRVTPIWADPADVVPFVAKVARLRPDFGRCRTMAVVNCDGMMVAGLIFHNWHPEHEVMEVTAAAIDRRWATRSVLQAGFGYVFDHCQLAVCRTDPANRPVIRLWTAFGAEKFIIPRLRGRNASEAILTLTDDAWASSKFMRGHNGQILASGTPRSV